MSIDERLAQWRDAAVSGGLPAPGRTDRWQPLRAGVVNLWEFEAAEYWYAEGWVQLTGRNETGKSSLMALTTLIPWLADTSSTNIDTLGTSGKRFRYYVGPSGEPGDRRANDVSTHQGWLWVEFGRVTPAGPEFFTTLLFAEARSAASNLRLNWCTAAGQARVRAGLELLSERTVTQPKDITAQGFVHHRIASAYKAEVARQLLGSTPERLDTVGRILKVTRTPKLGEQLKVSFIQQHLLEALPQLDRGEVDKLAEGWDQLDQTREDLERAKNAAEAIDRFVTRSWRPWARAALRLAADLATVARTKFDQVTKSVRDAEAALEHAQRSEAEVARRLTAAQGREQDAEAAATELRESTQYRDAHSRIQQAQRAKEREKQGSKLAEDAAMRRRHASESHEQATEEVTVARAARDEAQAEVGRLSDALRTAARAAQLQAAAEPDTVLLRQQVRDREHHLMNARTQLRAAAGADAEAQRQEDVAEAWGEAARDAKATAEAAWAEAESQRDTLAHDLDVWAGSLNWPVDVEPWQSSLPASGSDVAVLRVRITQEWHQPLHRQVAAQEHRAADAVTQAEEEIVELNDEIAQLSQTVATAPAPPTLWARRSRPADGAPLWRLINPVEGLPAGELAFIESAMAAAGVLDAWVDDSGVTDLQGDTFVDPAPAVEQNLTRVLQAAPGPWQGRVTSFLEGVHVVWAGELLPGSGLAIALDGRWRNSAVAGQGAPAHGVAEWVGEAAREAQRRRLIAELRVQVAEAELRVSTAREQLGTARAEVAALDAALAEAPDDAGLVRQLSRAEDAQQRAEQDAAQHDAAQARAQRQRTAADQLRAQFLEFVGEHALPATDEELDEVAAALGRLPEGITALESGLKDATARQEWLGREQGRLEAAVVGLADADQAVAEADRELAQATAQLNELNRAVGADDAQLLRRLDELTSEQGAAKREAKDLAQQELGLVAQRADAQAKLEAAAQDRGDATEQRDVAYREFRQWIDADQDRRLELNLPDRDSSAVRSVREQVVAVREQIRPPRWPGGPTEAERFVERQRDALFAGVHQTRTELEVSGRSLRVITGDFLEAEVLVDASGTHLPLHQAQPRLHAIHTELRDAYNAEVQRTLDELLGSTFLDHLRERVASTSTLITGINKVLRAHPTGTDSTTIRIQLVPREGHHDVLDALETGKLLNPEVAEQVRAFLKERVDFAKREAAQHGEASWREGLAQQLDYRYWYEVRLEHRRGGSKWGPLTSSGFAKMSGGARAVTLMMPLVATLAALYAEMDSAPRPLWLDEAFDGLDASNRAMVMHMLRSFDLDVLLVGPGRLVNVAEVPAAAIYQVVRAPALEPGADLTLELWAGGTLEAIDLPLSWDSPREHFDQGPQDSLL